MAALDPNAQSDAQGAQQLHNSGVKVFARTLAELLSRIKGSDVRLEDITLFSGREKVFPGDNANDIELSAKLKDAFTNADSKASLRVFLEYADGTKEEIFRQTAGKVIRDDFGLAPELRNMYAQQKADAFGVELRPKVNVEIDGAVQANKPLETVVQELKKPSREDIANAVPLSDEQVNQEIEQINAKEPEKRSIEFIGGLTPQQAYQMDDAQLKHAYLTAQYVKGQLLEIHGQSKAPGNEHLMTDPATQDLRVQYDAAVKTIEDRLAVIRGQKVEQKAEVVAESSKESVKAVTSRYGLSLEDTVDPEQILEEQWDYGGPEEELSPEEVDRRAAIQQSIQQAPLSENLGLETKAVERMTGRPPETQAQKTERWMLDAIMPKTAVIAAPMVEHIAPIADVAESLSLAHHAERTLEMVPTAPSAHTGDVLAVAPFLFEVATLSSQIEALRDKANSHLADLQEFAGDMRAAAEPRLQQWAERVEAAVEVKSQTWRERLQNAASSLVDTVKNRAISDVKIVVEVVKDRAAEDWSKTVDAAKNGASNAWEAAQRSALGSDAVDKGIDTVVRYLGIRDGSDGIAELDGYKFARRGQDTAIFKGDEPVYKNGLMTDKASVADAAYIARFPNVAEKAAAVADELIKNATVSQSQGASAGAARRR